ncbi:MAG: hypothetical protein KDI06_20320 [Calditrichaeota bacterium]|nr:hypothetical protein [Calditrichota bacterium]
MSEGQGMTWLVFVVMTIVCWGLYGIFLHSGQINMADPLNGRYKAFLFVGIAYFITAILGPVVMLLISGTDWHFPASGMWWSLIAGVVGAVGAFGVLLAFGAKGSPAVVMSLIFAGAPIVNAVVAILMHPPQGGLSAIRWQFYAGILIAAIGAYMVVAFKPGPGPAKKAISEQQSPH